MIKEAYVSFEVAKLLKEKGFNEPVTGLNKLLFKEGEKSILKVTHQKAMKWLREVHYLWIDIDPLTNHKWTWSIWFMNDPDLKMGESSQVISTYEEAVEAALKHCLENLI